MLIASPSLVDIAYKSLRSVFDTMGKKAYNYTFYKDSCLVMFTIFILYHYQKALPVLRFNFKQQHSTKCSYLALF